MANNSVYQMVTDRIIAELEKGHIPWQKPWVVGTTSARDLKDLAYNRVTGRPYSLLNQMLLGMPGEWMSFKQCKAAGGSIRKGEKGRPVVFWKQQAVKEEDTDKDGQKVEKTKMIPILRYYTVFHVSQTTLEPKKRPEEETTAPTLTWEPEEEAEAILTDYFTRSGVKFTNQSGDRAYYTPGFDAITVPLKTQFKDMAEYYSTVYHETVHSTGHKSRLDRFKPNSHFGSGEYSREELVAELGSAISLHRLGIETDYSFRNSTAYIQNWLEHLREDNKAIVFAASRAEKAVKLIFNDQAEEAAKTETTAA